MLEASGLTRTKSRGPPDAAARKSRVMRRASALRSATTESSRSRMSTSAFEARLLARFFALAPGAKNSDLMMAISRSGPAALHQRRPLADGHDFAALVERAVLELDEPGIGPRFAVAQRKDAGHRMDGVAVKHRLGEAHVGHPEIGDRRADRGVAHREPDHQAEGEQAVHETLAEFARGGELGVEMERLRVHRHHREQRVVRLGDGAADRVLDGLSDGEFLEIETRQRSLLWRADRAIMVVPDFSGCRGRSVNAFDLLPWQMPTRRQHRRRDSARRRLQSTRTPTTAIVSPV